MFLLDTDMVSELRRRDRTHPAVAAWADGTLPAETFLSVVTVLELETGALRLARRDPLQGSRLHRWIDEEVLPAFAGRILAIDTAVARRCARLHVPDPRAERDALIAATALVHGLSVVTRNVTDFAPMKVPIINPWVVGA